MDKPAYYEIKLVTHDLVQVETEIFDKLLGKLDLMPPQFLLKTSDGEIVNMDHAVKITPVYEYDGETVVTAPTPNQVAVQEAQKEKEKTSEDILNEAKAEAE